MHTSRFSVKATIRRLFLCTAMASAVAMPVMPQAFADPVTGCKGGSAENGAQLAEALGNAVSGNISWDNAQPDLVTLEKDIAELQAPLVLSSPTAQTNSHIILDLKGHTLDVGKDALNVINGLDLTVKDSSAEKTGKITGSGETVISLGANTSKQESPKATRNGSAFNFEAGTVENTVGEAIGEAAHGVNAITATKQSTVNIGEATVTASTEFADDAIDASDASNVYLNNSSIDGNKLGIDATDGADVKIQGDKTVVVGKGAIEIGDNVAHKEATTQKNNATFLMTDGLLKSDADPEEPTVTASFFDRQSDSEKYAGQIQGGTIESTYGTAIQVGSSQAKSSLLIENATVQQGTLAEPNEENPEAMVSAITVYNQKDLAPGEAGTVVAISRGTTITNANTKENGGYAVLNGSKEELGGEVSIDHANISTQGSLPTVASANGGNLTIGAGANIQSPSTTFGAVYVGLPDTTNPTTLTMTDGTVKNNAPSDGYGILAIGDATLNLSGGTVSAPTGTGIASSGSYAGTKVTISDSVNVSGNYGIYAPSSGGELMLNGGHVTGTTTGVEIRGGNAVLDGATIETKSEAEPTFTANAAPEESNGPTVSNAAIAISTNANEAKIKFTSSTGNVVTPRNSKAAALYVTSDQAPSAEDPIELQITNGSYEGAIRTPGFAGYINGGTFISAGDTFNTSDASYISPTALAIKVVPRLTPETYYVGPSATESLPSIESGSSIEFLNVPGEGESREFNVKIGVSVKNSTDAAITVNEMVVDPGREIVIKEDVETQLADLKAQIDRAEALDPNEWVADGYQNMLLVLQSAKELYESEAPSAKDIIAKTTELRQSIDSLQKDPTYDPIGDKSELALLLKTAETYKESDWIAGSWQRFQEAYNAAQEVYNSENPLKSQIDEVATALKAAMDGLERANTPTQALEELKALVAELEAEDASKWTEESFAKLQAKIEEAKQIIETEPTNKAKITAITADLKTARDDLVPVTKAPVVDKKELEELITQAQGIKNQGYPDALWTNFQTALNAAIQVNEADDATAIDVGQAKNALRTAMNALLDIDNGVNGPGGIAEVSYTGLQNLITQAEALNESSFTSETWSALQNALAAAKTVASNPAATQSEIDSAATALSTALSGLKSTTQQGGNATGTQVTQTANGTSTTSGSTPVTSKIASKMPDTGFAAFGSILTSIAAFGAGIFTKRRSR